VSRIAFKRLSIESAEQSEKWNVTKKNFGREFLWSSVIFLGDIWLLGTAQRSVALVREGGRPKEYRSHWILPEIPFVRVLKESGWLMTLKASYVWVPQIKWLDYPWASVCGGPLKGAKTILRVRIPRKSSPGSAIWPYMYVIYTYRYTCMRVQMPPHTNTRWRGCVSERVCVCVCQRQLTLGVLREEEEKDESETFYCATFRSV